MNAALARRFLFLLAIALPACAQSGRNSPTAATTSPPAAAVPVETQANPAPAEETATPTPAPTPARPELPFSQYSLSAVLDYALHQASVDQQIEYVNHAGEPLPELLLLVEPARYPGGFQLRTLQGPEGQAIEDYQLSGAQLRLPLEQPLPPGGRYRLSLSYDLLLPNQAAPFGYTERQANLGDWYPYLPPYTPGQGWLAREDAYYGEHLAYDVADFQVEFRLAAPTDAEGRKLIVAASAQPEMEGDRYRYRLDAARSFALTVSPLYQVLETRAGEVAISSYSFPFHPAADAPALETTARALALFSELFSPYPHESLSVVEADFLDGMEYDGLFFLSHAFYDYYTGDARSNLAIIAAHETSHQWWYGLVGNDQALEPWLDEALTTYSELLFYENVYPELATWWWDNRIYFHKPEGWVDSTIYQAAGFYPYRNAVYLRGAMFLGELRERLGDEAFFAFLRDYLANYTYRQATADDFFEVLSRYASSDLSDLVGSYFSKR